MPWNADPAARLNVALLALTSLPECPGPSIATKVQTSPADGNRMSSRATSEPLGTGKVSVPHFLAVQMSIEAAPVGALDSEGRMTQGPG